MRIRYRDSECALRTEEIERLTARQEPRPPRYFLNFTMLDALDLHVTGALALKSVPRKAMSQLNSAELIGAPGRKPSSAQNGCSEPLNLIWKATTPPLWKTPFLQRNAK